MIQRKQSIFLLLAVAAMIVCLCLPIGSMQAGSTQLGQSSAVPSVYNLGIYTSTGFAAHPLPFVDLVIAGTLSFICIFLYRWRKTQMRACLISIVLCVLWYGCFAGEWALIGFKPHWACALPLVAIVFLALAYRGVRADERLVRSADRIR